MKDGPHEILTKHLSEKVKNIVLISNKLFIFLWSRYQLLGTVNIQSQLDSVYRRSVKEHNEKVLRNRYLQVILQVIMSPTE
jgi:hypothetical protein